MMLGSSPEEELIVYRGFDPTKEDSAVGFLSAAYANGAQNVIDDVIAEVAAGDTIRLFNYIVPHTQPGGWRDRGLTPFISATPELEIAKRYAHGEGEQVATMVVRADQLVTDAMFTYEALVIGYISPEQIVAVEDAPNVPSFNASYPAFDSSMLDRSMYR
ncbi:MAG: hypothetical protein QG553_511 [Patescibacteria group bacterium]|nr:hypothetical protein [Patescibacteria group bacterium]